MSHDLAARLGAGRNPKSNSEVGTKATRNCLRLNIAPPSVSIFHYKTKQKTKEKEKKGRKEKRKKRKKRKKKEEKKKKNKRKELKKTKKKEKKKKKKRRVSAQ